MERFYVPHRLKAGDITNLSDEASRLIKDRLKFAEGEKIEVRSIDKLFLAEITFIDSASVEVEILSELEVAERSGSTITIVQSLINEKRFNLVVEKAVELGVVKIIPTHSEYSPVELRTAMRSYLNWQRIVEDAVDQSRNSFPPTLEKPTELSDLEKLLGKRSGIEQVRICLSSESINRKKLSELVKFGESKDYIIAVGAEKGWSDEDLKVLEELNFKFATLGDTILRAETAPLAISSIINYASGRY